MLDANKLKMAMQEISDTMSANRQYLIELDQRNGDGDLGISMSEGFAAASKFANESDETDLGKLLIGAGKVFNEAAPSSLGTIMSLCMMGMARVFKGRQTADIAMLGEAFAAGVSKIMERANSKPGEKTVLDALDPAARALCENASMGSIPALEAACKAAREGSQSTAAMKAVHGRAAYYGDKAIGLIDGGSVAGMLVFEAILKAAQKM
jgi:dihydroxyacetone kinase-like protein